MPSVCGPEYVTTMPFKMNLIVAVSEGMGIGKNNTLPWHLPKEFKYFQEKTTKTQNSEKVNAVILGRKCWESIPVKFRPLKNRINFVISSTLKDVPEGAYLCRSFEEACSILSKPPLLNTIETVWNIGGREIYDVIAAYTCRRLPDVPEDVQEENNICYQFEVYEKFHEE